MTQWGLDTLFNPAKRHMDEEKRRLLSTREEMGDSSGGKRIDLESGKVTIRRAESDAEETDAEETDAEETDAEETDGDTTERDSTDKTTMSKSERQRPAGRVTRAKKNADDVAPSPAAQRAAARRRRQASEQTG
jgi:hypothetical protein